MLNGNRTNNEMKIDLSNHLQRAKAAKKANKKYFARLAKRPPAILDRAVKAQHEQVFAETDCLTCANCCKTTSPIWRDKDIERAARKFRLQPTDFIRKYLYRDADGDYVFHTAPCPFLGKDNYCSIYEARPNACREYPHTDRKQFHRILNLTLKNTEICPAALEIVKRLRAVLPV